MYESPAEKYDKMQLCNIKYAKTKTIIINVCKILSVFHIGDKILIIIDMYKNNQLYKIA